MPGILSPIEIAQTQHPPISSFIHEGGLPSSMDPPQGVLSNDTYTQA